VAVFTYESSKKKLVNNITNIKISINIHNI